VAKKHVTDRFEFIAVELIDEPDVAMRQTIDQVALVDLAEDIVANGIVQPLRLTPKGDRYEIVAGHRRYLAAVIAKLPRCPAIIRASSRGEIEAMKVSENSHREEVNAAEEAVYYERLLTEHCAGDVDVLCAMVRRTRVTVETRLLLLRGDPEVLAALQRRQLSIGVAQELNLIGDEGQRRMYLDAAVRGGATMRLVREWRSSYERLKAFQAGEAPPAEHYVPPPPQPPGSTLSCFVCDSNEDPHDLELIYLHRACKRLIVGRVMEQLKAPAPAPATKGA